MLTSVGRVDVRATSSMPVPQWCQVILMLMPTRALRKMVFAKDARGRKVRLRIAHKLTINVFAKKTPFFIFGPGLE